jgi:hypothetical protein
MNFVRFATKLIRKPFPKMGPTARWRLVKAIGLLLLLKGGFECYRFYLSHATNFTLLPLPGSTQIGWNVLPPLMALSGVILLFHIRSCFRLASFVLLVFCFIELATGLIHLLPLVANDLWSFSSATDALWSIGHTSAAALLYATHRFLFYERNLNTTDTSTSR